MRLASPEAFKNHSSSPPDQLLNNTVRQKRDKDSFKSTHIRKKIITPSRTESQEENTSIDTDDTANVERADSYSYSGDKVENNLSIHTPGSTAGEIITSAQSGNRGLVSRRGGRGGLASSPSRTVSHRVIDCPYSSSSSQILRSHSERNQTSSENTEDLKKSLVDDMNSAASTNRDAETVDKQVIDEKRPKQTADDTVPSLCSTLSGSLQTSSSSSSCSPNSPPKVKSLDQTNTTTSSSNTTTKHQQRSHLPINPQFDDTAMLNHSEDNHIKSQRVVVNTQKPQLETSTDPKNLNIASHASKHKPYSITLESTFATSPLHHDLKDKKDLQISKLLPQTSENDKTEPGNSHNEPPTKLLKKGSNKDDLKESRNTSRLLHSPPPSGQNLTFDNDVKQTPNFGLLTFHDAKSMSSPSGLFLSPYSPLGIIGDSPSFDRNTPRTQVCNTPNDRSSSNVYKPSAVTSESKNSQDRAPPIPSDISNPTTPRKSQFEANPFSWLTSPTQGFFSPNSDSGRAIGASITTPTFSSMFFQEAGKSNTSGGPTSQTEEKGGNFQIRDLQRHHPYSKMICISPLAPSRKHRCKSTGDLPSYSSSEKPKRKLETYDDLLNVPLSSPTLHFDMHVAEKDLMEDEDLSVLLHLASSGHASSSTSILNRSSSGKSPGPKKYSQQGPPSNPTPSSLQLPLMGGPEAGLTESTFPPKLSRMTFRKTSTKDRVERSMSNEFVPPSLPIRPTKSRDLKASELPPSNTRIGSVPTIGNDNKLKSTLENKNLKSRPSKQIVASATKKIGASNMGSSKDLVKPTKTRKKKNVMILQNPMCNPSGRTHMAVPSNNFQHPNISGPHARNMHPHPVGSHDASGRPMGGPGMNMSRGYHEGMNHSGHPMGDMPPMQHHMPPSGYPQNGNPHLMPHPMPPGQMQSMPPQGSMGAVPYHYPHPPHMPHPPHPPQPIPTAGQYAPYTTLNQSHAKSKMSNKKNAGLNSNSHSPGNTKHRGKKGKSASSLNTKRPGNHSDDIPSAKKKMKATPIKGRKGAKGRAGNMQGTEGILDSGEKNTQAAALAAAILRGVTMRPSGKWQAQLYYAGKSRYIGVFGTREKAALAYEIAREKLKSDKSPDVNSQCIQDTEAAVSLARKAAFEGVNEPDPRPPHKR